MSALPKNTAVIKSIILCKSDLTGARIFSAIFITFPEPFSNADSFSALFLFSVVLLSNSAFFFASLFCCVKYPIISFRASLISTISLIFSALSIAGESIRGGEFTSADSFWRFNPTAVPFLKLAAVILLTLNLPLPFLFFTLLNSS